jgi:hypothetical protein
MHDATRIPELIDPDVAVAAEIDSDLGHRRVGPIVSCNALQRFAA